MHDFNKELESNLEEINCEQIAFFLWLFSLRILPFLGEDKTFSFWDDTDLMKNIYAIFIALDEMSLSVLRQSNPKFKKEYVHTETLVKYCNGVFICEIPIYGENHRNITLAAEVAKHPYSHIPTAVISMSYFISVLLDNDSFMSQCVMDLFNSFDIRDLKTDGIAFGDIVLNDVRCIKSNEFSKLNTETSVYGNRWGNLKVAFKNYGCKYWWDLYADIFNSGFRINIKALNHRLDIPVEVKTLGAKTIAEHLSLAEKQDAVGFRHDPKYYIINMYKEIFKSNTEEPTEMKKFFYKRCSDYDKVSDAKNENCPFCSGKFSEGVGIGIIPNSSLLDWIELFSNGYNLTCGRCANVFYSKKTNDACPRCGNTDSKNYMPNLSNGIKLTQEIKIVKKDVTKPSKKSKVFEMKIRDEKPQKDGSTAMFRRIIDKENDNYQELVVINETGEIKHKCNEPLSEHQGHGSAKDKQVSFNNNSRDVNDTSL